jgi:TonB family protein
MSKVRSPVGRPPSVTFVIFSLLAHTNKLRLMKRVSAFLFLIILSPLVLGPAALGQQEQTESSRKIVNRVMPQYPEMARTMNLRGSVKAEALVQPNGAVKSVDVKGGHPVLVRAAQDAIYKWKWAPASHETREPIEVKFDPPALQ